MNEIVTVAEGQFDKMATGITELCGNAQAIVPQVTFDPKVPEQGKKAYLEADRLLAEINRAYNHVEEKRKELTKPLDEVKAKIMEAAKLKTGPLLAMKEILRGVMGRFANAEEAWAAAERRRKDAEELKRKEDERLSIAASAEKAGEHKMADQILEAPMKVRPAYVPTADDSAKSTRRKVWNVELTDAPAFINAWLTGRAPSGSVTIDLGLLKRLVAAQKGEVEWPGIRVYQEIEVGSGR